MKNVYAPYFHKETYTTGNYNGKKDMSKLRILSAHMKLGRHKDSQVVAGYQIMNR